MSSSPVPANVKSPTGPMADIGEFLGEEKGEALPPSNLLSLNSGLFAAGLSHCPLFDPLMSPQAWGSPCLPPASPARRRSESWGVALLDPADLLDHPA
eukprot:CAMPEP_0169445540 /NCGR_PEP_ID=MMETSP1042-20121227/10494_1 /TAXON_ID=464988 /ORGANISM="Hemiselmis andersenii, Strain CCMP1180" /LENGTH=97 /DNA_ID=CAMNT_0009556943 /DNA_START=572 /DNA_END=863 /DNA_ORIENTATION=+